MDFKSATELLASGRTARSRETRKVANNTYLERLAEDEIGLRLHNTYVLRFKPDRTIYNTGGWYTVTTKDRINGFGPGGVYSTRGTWFYHPPKSDGYGYDWETEFPFFDGIEVSPDGLTVLNPMDVSEFQREESERKTKKNQIRRFVRLAMKNLANGIPAQDSGDCFYCQMRGIDSGDSLGDMTDSDHLELHIAENYFPSSLYWNAVEAKGYRMPAFILGYDAETGMIGNGREFHDGVKRALTSYLNKRLIKNAATV